jgi:hypothetical protein
MLYPFDRKVGDLSDKLSQILVPHITEVALMPSSPFIILSEKEKEVLSLNEKLLK